VLDGIRALRVQREWSQQQLADRAGVTRQLVSAVESGRHSPNVSAALGLARALGTTVEALFGPPAAAGSAAPVLGQPAPTGATVLTARVGERLVAVPQQAVNPERWTVGDAVSAVDGVQWLPEGRTDGLVLAGCDPVLGLLAELVERSTPHRLVAVHASTGRAVEALAAGTVHGAMVHATAGGFPPPPVPVRRWHVAGWLVGLASAGATGPPPVAELAQRRARVAQREPGAASQQALWRALRRAGVERALDGPVGEGHLDVARRVLAGEVEAGLTMEAAAVAFGLGFAALEEHEVELWIDGRWAGEPGVSALGDVLCGASFLRRAERLAGYEMTGCGSERTGR
jgi:transcriptional regulator with XRE-family HTH domain